MSTWKQAARCASPLPHLLRQIRAAPLLPEVRLTFARLLPNQVPMLLAPRGAHGIMGLSWPQERHIKQAENSKLEEELQQLEKEQSEQLVKLAELQKSLQCTRMDLVAAQGKVKDLEEMRKTSELQKVEALATADDSYDRTLQELERMQGVLSKVSRVASLASRLAIGVIGTAYVKPGPVSPTLTISRATDESNEEGGKSWTTEPILIGGRQFANFDEIWSYSSALLKDSSAEARLGSEDESVMMDLLIVGHPDYARKLALTNIETGAKPEQIHVCIQGDADIETGGGKAFTVIKSDESKMSFSYRRCIWGLKKKVLRGETPSSMKVSQA